MARAEMTPENQQRVCAIRLPGTSRARFVDAGDVECRLGDWVTVDNGFGEEPGQIVVAPDQWLEPIHMDDIPVLLRRLNDDDLERIAENIERARGMISTAADIVRQENPSSFLSGLRLTLNADALIAVYIGNTPENPDELTIALREVTGFPTYLEQDLPDDPERAMIGGGAGTPQPQRPETFQELLAGRLDALRTPGVFAPQGIPRLGSKVATPHGSGQLVAVDIRHWKATVAIESGEIELSVDELAEPQS
jgi:hypothetical protein